MIFHIDCMVSFPCRYYTLKLFSLRMVAIISFMRLASVSYCQFCLLKLSRLYRLCVWPLFPTANFGFCLFLICDLDAVDAVFIFDF